MILALGALSVVIGTTIAYFANAFPRFRSLMETIGGILLLGGFSVLGYALQLAIGVP